MFSTTLDLHMRAGGQCRPGDEIQVILRTHVFPYHQHCIAMLFSVLRQQEQYIIGGAARLPSVVQRSDMDGPDMSRPNRGVRRPWPFGNDNHNEQGTNYRC